MLVNKKDKKPDSIFLICLGIYISWQMAGIIGAIPGLRGAFQVAMAAITTFLAVFLTPNFLKKAFVENKGLLLIICVLLIVGIDFFKETSLDSLMMFLPVIVYFCSGIYLSDKDKSKCFIIWLLLNWIFKIAVTFSYLPSEELIVKRYDHLGYAEMDGIVRCIIGYSSIYLMTPFIILLLPYCKLVKGKKSTKAFIFISISLMIALVYLSQVSMMIFSLSLLLLAYYLLGKEKDGKIVNKKTYIILLIGIICVFIFRIELLTWVSSWGFLGDTVHNRVQGLLTVLQNDMDYIYSHYSGMLEGDSVINRFYAYAESVKAFFHNFFLGKLTPKALTSGGHSQIIDMGANYGIIVVVLWIAFNLYAYKQNKSKTVAMKSIILVYIYMIAISILNNFSVASVSLISFILIPQMLLKREVE